METFTFLSDDPEAVQAFVAETHHLTEGRSSHFSKIRLYQQYFPDMQPRTKLTGFEKLSKEDATIRQKLSNAGEGWLITGYTPAKVDNPRPYLEVMRSIITALPKDVLIFYSGGIDSEFVIRLFELFEKPFTPIIFLWRYENAIINSEDVTYALNFCIQRKITPIIKTLNIQEFWNSDEIVEISQRLQDVSPQRCTYKKASDICAKEYPDHYRIFAGEIRYVVRKVGQYGS